MNKERKHIRLSDWDYSKEGVYFITICCKERISYFGAVQDNEMFLSEIGVVASGFWLEIPDHFSHVKLDEFIVMPNHIHGIIILDYSIVGSRHDMSIPLKPVSHQNLNRFSKPVKNSISVIINQYKSTVKRWSNKNEYNYFEWQPRFYEQILWNEKSVDHIREYIYTNPKHWIEDELYNC